ncbi:MAG: hypothetical protein KAR35_01320 [Candidatus Heimdallarchaeota archaeon]|nr:hypothetical protein [Candidatus Heimdallarchaeota archaeon]MCK5047995.1 hypothetical protein [Candidatus Heimdallarchaeota archaeon]
MVDEKYTDDTILLLIASKLDEGLCPERSLLGLPDAKAFNQCKASINLNGESASTASKKINFQYQEISMTLSSIFENDSLNAKKRISDLSSIIKNRRKLLVKKKLRYKTELRRIKIILIISTVTTAILAIFAPIFNSLSYVLSAERQTYPIHPYIIFYGLVLSNISFLMKIGNESNIRKTVAIHTIIYLIVGFIGNSILN